jgi:hypothetical protein
MIQKPLTADLNDTDRYIAKRDGICFRSGSAMLARVSSWCSRAGE